MEQLLAPIVSANEMWPGVHLLWARAPEIAQEAKPGQFVMVRCGNTLNPLLRRPISIHQARGDQIALLFQVVGKGTEWLSERTKGDNLDLLGPLGKGFHVDETSSHLLLMAGGIGIAPLAFLAEKALNDGRSVDMILGARTAARLYPKRLLPRRAEVLLVTEAGSKGEMGMATHFTGRFADRVDQVFACGPAAMYRSLRDCHELNRKQVQISLEVMMGCGVGACYGCTVMTASGARQVCKDGPIFDLKDISR